MCQNARCIYQINDNAQVKQGLIKVLLLGVNKSDELFENN